ncbi:hypothetical protein HBH98_150890 [Parastagonospora nodorum]|nr:hypothetical protein HBH53_162480 [Parastagonospora nodorum]KAH3990695.1 hypothetical protein HBH52_003230 [Parastagonospora nodorum]KAH4034736.1 hypothetical protein HBI09_102630 [Parastagonospora nodorum]KAH4116960.1 hypothetical protein HBH47_157940 [Parastagonospora nodorum]KAH4203596.1 hypothetical protein HBH42_003430 [Parastagonospora nodorum]
MENPVKEIPGIIHLLTQSPPSIQYETIETYFTPTASFTHPFCRTGSHDNSRWLIAAIYRWYKIMSPRIDVSVQSVAFDEANLTLYVQIFQIFRIWLVPFYYAPVELTTVLKLRHDKGDNKYYIHSQNDLYQVDQWIRFILPGGHLLIYLWHAWATFFCVVGAYLLIPVTWIEEYIGWGQGNNAALERQRSMSDKDREWKWLDGRSDERVVMESELRGKLLG